ncbi:MAG: hypothetical protein MZV64_32850 [Ignavibacteriales bacterium]|nr:hypothetical protein [Ignavibacteriales bacterium]
MDYFSGHADQNELIDYLQPESCKKVKKHIPGSRRGRTSTCH